MSIWSGIRSGGEGTIPFFGPIMQGQAQQKAFNDLQTNEQMWMNPLYQPQRQEAQGRLSSLESPQGAADFLQTDPLVTQGTKYLQNEGSANFAKSGNLPTTDITQNAAITQLMAGEYNNRVNQFQTQAGYNQPIPGYLPAASTGIGTQGISSLFGGEAQGGGQLINMMQGNNPYTGESMATSPTSSALGSPTGNFVGNLFGGGGGGGGGGGMGGMLGGLMAMF